MVAQELEELGVPYLLFNQREFAAAECELEIAPEGITGALSLHGHSFPLETITGVYTRLVEYQILPELYGVPFGNPLHVHCRRLHEALLRWYEIAPGRVVNRTAPMGSNSSKPYQAQLIRQYFAIPETLITNDPKEVLAFRERHKRIVYKSISGVRSIVREFTDGDLDRLSDLRWCPVQFQQLITGVDIRVHVVGANVFATSVASNGIDYRYAHQQEHGEATLAAVTIPDEVAVACVELTRALGLEFAGVDLKLSDNGEIYCFEANPSPAYSYYEVATQQPIARALARYLAFLDGIPV